ncbi:unnamed protein product [Lactuca virosa]|uniref:Uncharacterized protein n=1 Tax=Lactuca virosa TaxID=75947 RepID=A0AAU9MSJ3_9ASTR|nr:unnamed protein product [Lactuca virosa]
MAPQMSLSHSDGALKIVDADEESSFTFFDSYFIETGLSLEELRWKFYEKSIVVGPPLSVEISNSPPMAMETNLVRVPVGDADRPFFPLSSDTAASADSLPCEGVGPHPHSDRRSSPLMADQVFLGNIPLNSSNSLLPWSLLALGRANVLIRKVNQYSMRAIRLFPLVKTPHALIALQLQETKHLLLLSLPLMLHLCACLSLNPSLSVFYADSSITQNSGICLYLCA